MAKKIYINDLNTYIGAALHHELRNDTKENDTPNEIFGSYIDKDLSDKPQGIKKMLKRSKPKLMRKKISECDIIIYDLHYGNPNDVLGGLEAMKKTGEEEKIFILISSLLLWDSTGAKMKPKNPPPPPAEGEDASKEVIILFI